MVESHLNEVLNEILVGTSRSLLQYVGECWPWTEKRDDRERATVAGAVYRQREGVQQLADLLRDRNWPTDFGAYPTAYTDLHFVELDYLLPQIVASEKALSGDLERAVERCFSDPAAVDVLRGMLDSQVKIVRDLEGLVGTRSGSGV